MPLMPNKDSLRVGTDDSLRIDTDDSLHVGTDDNEVDTRLCAQQTASHMPLPATLSSLIICIYGNVLFHKLTFDLHVSQSF